LSAGRQVTTTGAETPEAPTGAPPEGALDVVPSLVQALEPSARARLAIPIHAVFFTLSSSVPPCERGLRPAADATKYLNLSSRFLIKIRNQYYFSVQKA
jgi:hypothetical protein